MALEVPLHGAPKLPGGGGGGDSRVKREGVPRGGGAHPKGGTPRGAGGPRGDKAERDC